MPGFSEILLLQQQLLLLFIGLTFSFEAV